MTSSDSYFLPVALTIIMFGIGMNLKFSNFKTVLTKPKAVFTGLFGQMILLPAFAFLIAAAYPGNNAFKIGLVLIAACPGGTSSNLVTYMLKGRTELSVALTTFNSFLIIFTIPIILNLGIRFFAGETRFIEIETSYVLTEVLFTVLMPVLGGMLFYWKFPDLTAKLRKPLRYILPGILFAVFAFVLFLENNNGTGGLIKNYKLLPAAFILNIGSMLIGYYFSRISGITHSGRYTIAVEMGLQNSALAIFLAQSVLKMNDVALIAVIYGSISFFVTLLAGYLMKTRLAD